MTTSSPQTLHPFPEDETQELGLREPPHNLEVEAALLGAVLRNNRAFEQVSDLLSAEHFYAPEHQRIYSAIRQITEKGQIANATTLSHGRDLAGEITHRLRRIGGFGARKNKQAGSNRSDGLFTDRHARLADPLQQQFQVRRLFRVFGFLGG